MGRILTNQVSIQALEKVLLNLSALAWKLIKLFIETIVRQMWMIVKMNLKTLKRMLLSVTLDFREEFTQNLIKYFEIK